MTVTPLVGHDRRGMIDRSAAASTAELLLLWDASVKAISENSLYEMASLAQRPWTGLVSPVVTDRHGRIVHAGYALMQDGRVLGRNRGLLLKAGGRNMLERRLHNAAACSTRCCMLRRSIWQPVSGLGDGAWSLRIEGHHTVTPNCVAVADRWPKDTERLEVPVHDPCISKWYTKGTRADFRLRGRRGK